MITTIEICIPHNPAESLENLENCYVYPHDNWMDVEKFRSDGEGFFAVTVEHPAYETEMLEMALNHLQKAIEITDVETGTPYIARSDLNDDLGDEYGARIESIEEITN